MTMANYQHDGGWGTRTHPYRDASAKVSAQYEITAVRSSALLSKALTAADATGLAAVIRKRGRTRGYLESNMIAWCLLEIAGCVVGMNLLQKMCLLLVFLLKEIHVKIGSHLVFD